MPKLHAVLRNLTGNVSARAGSGLKIEPVEREQPRRLTTSQRAIAARNAVPAQNGAVQLDATSPVIDDTIPDGD